MTRRDYKVYGRRRERLTAVAVIAAITLLTALTVYVLLEVNEILVAW